MDIRAIAASIVDSCVQIGAAVIITLLQRYLLQLSTPEKDIAWLKKQKVYSWFMSAKWYRGMEAYHQWNAARLYREML